MRLTPTVCATAVAFLALASPAPAPTEELYGNYNFVVRLGPTGEGLADVVVTKSLMSMTARKSCVRLRASGLPAGDSVDLRLRRGPVGGGGEVLATHSAGDFQVGATGSVDTNQCVSITHNDDWLGRFRSRPTRFHLELTVSSLPDDSLAGRVTKRKRRR